MIDTDKGFTLVRLLDASPQAVWDAWTDPDQVAAWWHPRGSTTPRESVELDVRVGGRYRYTMVDDASGESVETGGVYREVSPVSRLVFTWTTPDSDSEDDPVVTVTIEDVGELTRLTFDLRGVDGSAGDQFFYDGWASALDVLSGYLGQNEVFG